MPGRQLQSCVSTCLPGVFQRVSSISAQDIGSAPKSRCISSPSDVCVLEKQVCTPSVVITVPGNCLNYYLHNHAALSLPKKVIIGLVCGDCPMEVPSCCVSPCQSLCSMYLHHCEGWDCGYSFSGCEPARSPSLTAPSLTHATSSGLLGERNQRHR